MSITPSCTTHTADPEPECEDCLDQFCADCGKPLTTDNSDPGFDVCCDCADQEEGA